MKTLTAKTAIITGAGRGIGRAIAEAFAAQGAALVLAGRSVPQLEETAQIVRAFGARALVVPTDVGLPAQVEAMVAAAVAEFGVIDTLVNNSGIAGPSLPLWEITPEQWEETMRVNLTGVYLCCRAVIPVMIKGGGGSIITIGSVAGKRPRLHRSPYGASKMGVVGLTRTLAWDVGPHGIRANVISPGAVEGPRIDWVFQAQAEARGISAAQVRAEVEASSPLGRLVRAPDVAAAAVFLASDAAATITGEDLNISAGAVME